MNKNKIPKGWRQVRQGEILPRNHKWFDGNLNEWMDNGDPQDYSGRRFIGWLSKIITIIPK